MISNTVIVRGGEYKCIVFKMHLKLRDKQLKTIMHIYRLLYKNLMVTTIQKSIVDIHTKKKKESKHNTKDSHKIIREQKKGEKKNYKDKSKTINKMAVRTYISIINLNVNGINAPVKRHRLAE